MRLNRPSFWGVWETASGQNTTKPPIISLEAIRLLKPEAVAANLGPQTADLNPKPRKA